MISSILFPSLIKASTCSSVATAAARLFGSGSKTIFLKRSSSILSPNLFIILICSSVKFSKRPGYYFMIRYKFDPATKKLRFFVSFAYLKKSDWKCPPSTKENYYATFIDLYNLSKCKDFEILRGSATTKVKNTVFHSVEI